MNLPIQFPSDAEVVAEEAKRFRALSSENRLEAIRSVLDAGALMLQNSSTPEFLVAFSAEQEEAFRRAVLEFVARHGH